MEVPRRFTHVEGFNDGTDYVEFHSDGRKLVYNKDGSIEENSIKVSLQQAEAWTRLGSWVELEVIDRNEEQSCGL